MCKKIILTIGAVIALMMSCGGVDAQADTLSQGDVVLTFNVENPDFTLHVGMPGPGGHNSTDAFAKATLNGTGRASGTFEAQSNTDTGWANLSGGYVGSAGDFSSTFQAEGLRTNTNGVEGLSSDFVTSQSIDTAGVGPLQFMDAGQVVSGLYVYGEAGACSVADTWALGAKQTFSGSADSVTVTVGRKFEQHNGDGSSHGDPNPIELSITTTDEDNFSGDAEGGSYSGTDLGKQGKPGFGFGSSTLFLQVRNGIGKSSSTARITDEIPDHTSTWYTYAGYSPPAGP